MLISYGTAVKEGKYYTFQSHTPLFEHVYQYSYIYIYMYMCVCVCVCVCIYIYIYIYIYLCVCLCVLLRVSLRLYHLQASLYVMQSDRNAPVHRPKKGDELCWK